MATINGGGTSINGKPIYYTPGVILDLAVTLAGFDASEQAALMLCKIHGYGCPKWDDDDTRNFSATKSNNPRLSKAFIANHIGHARSIGYRAVDSLIARRVLVLKGNNTIIINKWIDEWCDKDGHALFNPATEAGRQRLGQMLDSLDRYPWWQQPAAFIRSLLPPGKATRQIPFQSDPSDNANGVPSDPSDTQPGDLSDPSDKSSETLSDPSDTYSDPSDNRSPQTPENARKTAALEVNWNEDLECHSMKGRLTDFADLVKLCRTIPQGDEVCAELGRKSAPQFPRTSWLNALLDWQHNPSRDSIKRPTGYVIARARDPRTVRFAPARSQPPLTSQDSANAQAANGKAVKEHQQGRRGAVVSDRPDTDARGNRREQQLADDFARRPSAQQVGAIRELRESRVFAAYAAQLDKWLNAGKPQAGRPQAAMAAGEEACRAYLSGPKLETVAVQAPRKRGA